MLPDCQNSTAFWKVPRLRPFDLVDEDKSGALFTADRRTQTTSTSHVNLYEVTKVIKSSSLIKIIEQ
jgi:hypothetical protein